LHSALLKKVVHYVYLMLQHTAACVNDAVVRSLKVEGLAIFSEAMNPVGENLVISDTHADWTAFAVAGLRKLDGLKRVFFAGDACDGLHKMIPFFGDVFAGIPVYAVAGNHDLMRDGSPNGWNMHQALEMAREASAKAGNVTILDDEAIIDPSGIRILGCTLWTAFDLVPPAYSLKQAMYLAQNGLMPGEREYGGRRGPAMTDYKKIRYVDESGKERLFSPSHSIALHKQSRAWIESQLAVEHDAGPTVVLSHHAPHPDSLRDPSIREFSSLDFCYASDLSLVMTSDTAPEVWIHGHVHESRDYEVGGTRIVSNPRGYALSAGRFENPKWDPAFMIDIEKRDLTPRMGM
jgi:predicted phosphodiesterase